MESFALADDVLSPTFSTLRAVLPHAIMLESFVLKSLGKLGIGLQCGQQILNPCASVK